MEEIVEIKQVTTARGGRYYDVVRSRFGDDAGSETQRLYSVTTLLSRGLPKPALTRWLQTEVARKAVEYAEQLVSMKENGDSEAAMSMLTAFAGQKRDIAGETGSAIHAAIESLGGAKDVSDVAAVMTTLDDVIRPYVMQFLSWVEDCSPTFIMQEARCWSEKGGYAGTLDMICDLNGQRVILDVKTGKQPYPEAALQMALYAGSEYVMAEGDDVPTPTSDVGIEAAYVLHLRDDGWSLLPCDIGEDVQRIANYVVQIGGRWAYGLERDVLGDPVKEGHA
jgi:hypothetical protein